MEGDKELFVDMVQMLLRASNNLAKQGKIKESDRNGINSHLGAVKSIMYANDNFKKIYKSYCKNAVRLIG